MIPQEIKLLGLLSNNDVTFFIPPYQRNYEWTNEQCRVFLKDVVETCERNASGDNSEHFFGTVTYFQNETAFGQPNKLVLIDGQQRITTTMLFLVALRDIIDDDEIKQFIDSKYLKNNNVTGDSEYKIKLKQVETDWKAYRKIILLESLADSEKDADVYKNYCFFYNKLRDFKEKGKKLEDLIEKGIDKFSVVTVELQPEKNKWENPQEIFESMNSLGKPLSLADLVRNYLLLGLDADEQTKLYNKYWLHIESVLPRKVSGFIRDYMQGRQAKSYPKATETNYKTLYGAFKDIFGEKDVQELLEDLAVASDIYAVVISGQPSGNSKVDSMLKDFRSLNVTTAYSFLLMLLRTWKNGRISDDDIIGIIEVFWIYCFRKRLIGLTNAENKGFPALVGKIPELIKATDKRIAMFNILSRQENRLRVPNDIEIKRYVETMNFYNFRYCKLYLSLVEERLTKSRPDITDDKLQIEHIMPQTLNDEWRAALGKNCEEMHQQYVHSIGNLTLIRHNQELGQKPFDDKVKVYENNAGLQIARTKITDNKCWEEESIRSRSEWIIDYILQNVLPIPDSMRKSNNFYVKKSKGLSFLELDLIGMEISFIEDKSLTAKVVDDKKVEFEGEVWNLSPLTRELKTRNGTVNASGAYQGAQFWEFDGIRLIDIL